MRRLLTGRPRSSWRIGWRGSPNLLMASRSGVGNFRTSFDCFPWRTDEARLRHLDGPASRTSYRSSMRVCANSGRPASCTISAAWWPPPSWSSTSSSTGGGASSGSGIRWSMPTSPPTRSADGGWPVPAPTPHPISAIFNPVTRGKVRRGRRLCPAATCRKSPVCQDRFVHRPWDAPSPPADCRRRSFEHDAAARRRAPQPQLRGSALRRLSGIGLHSVTSARDRRAASPDDFHVDDHHTSSTLAMPAPSRHFKPSPSI